MNIVKKIILKIFYSYWYVKTLIYFKIFGPYGVSNCIEIMPYPFIIKFLRKYGATIGDGCNIERGLIIHRPDPNIPFKNLKLGNNIYVGHNLLIDLSAEFIMENNTAFGANCQVWTHTGDYKYNLNDKKDYHEIVKPVVIKEGTVCYSGVIIRQGCTLGEFSRVGAGSVVIKDISPRTVVAGLPAIEIKKREL